MFIRMLFGEIEFKIFLENPMTLEHTNKLGVVLMTIIPALGNLRQEELKFKANLGYIGSSRPAWTMN
jgi:hypothetical protein